MAAAIIWNISKRENGCEWNDKDMTKGYIILSILAASEIMWVKRLLKEGCRR